MKKYIIEYQAGTKGDLLIRFLNKQEVMFTSDKKTVPLKIGMPNYLKLLDPEMQTLEKYEAVLANNPFQFIGGHRQWHFGKKLEYDNLLKKYGYHIIKIQFDKRFFTTVGIESVIKNYYQWNEAEEDYQIKLENTKFVRRTAFGQEQMTNYEPEKTLQGIINMISSDSSNRLFKRFESFNNNDTENKTLLQFHDLYVDFNLEKYPLFEGYDLEEWKKRVENSWCADIELNGKKIILKDLGYRNF